LKGDKTSTKSGKVMIFSWLAPTVANWLKISFAFNSALMMTNMYEVYNVGG
jgi:hypothetical protein